MQLLRVLDGKQWDMDAKGDAHQDMEDATRELELEMENRDPSKFIKIKRRQWPETSG